MTAIIPVISVTWHIFGVQEVEHLLLLLLLMLKTILKQFSLKYNFCVTMQVFTVTFDQLNMSLLNESIQKE